MFSLLPGSKLEALGADSPGAPSANPKQQFTTRKDPGSASGKSAKLPWGYFCVISGSEELLSIFLYGPLRIIL